MIVGILDDEGFYVIPVHGGMEHGVVTVAEDDKGFFVPLNLGDLDVRVLGPLKIGDVTPLQQIQYIGPFELVYSGEVDGRYRVIPDFYRVFSMQFVKDGLAECKVRREECDLHIDYVIEMKYKKRGVVYPITSRSR